MFIYTQAFIRLLASVKMVRTTFLTSFVNWGFIYSSIDDIVVCQMVRNNGNA